LLTFGGFVADISETPTSFPCPNKVGVKLGCLLKKLV
jgi:hypothetical protein